MSAASSNLEHLFQILELCLGCPYHILADESGTAAFAHWYLHPGDGDYGLLLLTKLAL